MIMTRFDMFVEFAGQLACKSAVTSRTFTSSQCKPSAKAAQRSTKLVTEIDAKSFLGGPQGTEIDLKMVPGAFAGPPGRPRSSLGRSGVSSTCLGIVPGASQEHRESPQGRPEVPERVPGSAWERLGATKIESKMPPEAEKARFRCAPRSRTVFEAFSTIFVGSQVLRKMREPSKVSHLSAQSRVRPFALRVSSLERCCF